MTAPQPQPDPPPWLVPSNDIPDPPPGPGVRTPFAAPPTERDRKRLWIGLGVGLALLVVCCGGGVFGFGALVYTQSRAMPREAVSVVDGYLGALRRFDYNDAYALVCRTDQESESLQAFRVRQSQESPVTGYRIGQPRVESTAVHVPVVIDRDDGRVDRDFTLVEDQQAGGLRICGGE
jgi:hypothetical protein